MKKLLLCLPCLVWISGCSPKNSGSVQQVADNTTGAVGCTQMQSRTWDALSQYLIEQNQIPSASELKNHLTLSLRSLKSQGQPLTSDQTKVLNQDMQDLYDLLLVEAPQTVKAQSAQEVLSLMSALELGDHTTPQKVALQNKIQAQFAKIQKDAGVLQVDCAAPTPSNSAPTTAEAPAPSASDAPTTESFSPTTGESQAVWGIHLSMATAYQSCQALTEAPLTANSSSVQGISIVGTHPDGIGKQRVISSVSELVATDPYYKNVTSYGPNCINGKKSPLIYDYGGRPYATSGSAGTLNFFIDAGTGTSVLGVDCSGFVYTGLAASGLRLSPGVDMKATGVYGISSDMFVEPENNQMTCLQKISVTPQSTLKAGDVVAIYGHVVMIDSVGADPFGINRVGSSAGCSNLQAKDFDFVIIQSDPSIGGVGINRFMASDYLYNDNTMKVGLEKYAYYSCLAKFNQKSYTPNLGNLSVVRHTLTPSCIGNRVKLVQESCVQGCTAL